MKENKFLKSLLASLMAFSAVASSATPVFAEDTAAEPEEAVLEEAPAEAEELTEKELPAEELPAEEETAEDAAVEETVSFYQELEDVTVSAEAAANVFPTGTVMTVERVVDEATLEMAAQAVGENATTKIAVDITFTYEGEEIQPDGSIRVSINSPEIAELDNPVLVHVDDKQEDVVAEVVDQIEEVTPAEEVTADLDSFSVYAVVDDGQQGDTARAVVNFYGKDTTKPVATFYVKNDDLKEENKAKFEQIVYDPGVDGLTAGDVFEGWSISSKGTTDGLNYTVETEGKDIEGVRTFLKSLYPNIAEGDTYNIYAMIFKAYNVQFKDEDGAMIFGETLLNKEGEAVSYQINMDYTPKTEDQQFQGWFATTTATDAISPVQEKYAFGATVEIKGDVIFTPNAPKGNWLVFDANLGADTDNKASYTPPQFIETGYKATEPSEPTRVGYTFEGWYTEPACTTEFDFANTVIETRTTIYAKWTVVSTANYTVIVWKQRVSDDKNAADANKTYDVEEVITLSGNVGSTINVVTQPNSNTNVNTGRGSSVRNYSVNGSQKSYTGFHAGRYDTGVTVKANGTSVVNVYYDRNLITINFDAGSGRYIKNEVDGGYSRRVSYTGLFDAPLTFAWPSTNWNNASGTGTTYQNLWTHDSNNGGATLTFYGSFKLYVPTNVTETLTRANAGTTPVRFIKQKSDGSWPANTSDTENVLEIGTQGGTFTFSEKYAGFSVSQYRTTTYTAADTGWTSVRNSSGGYRSVSNYSQLNIRFTRDKYPINFFDGTYFNGDGVTLKEATKAPLDESEEIYYEASVASYNEGGSNYYEPTAPAGYVFAGWYVDSTCTVPYTFTTMPAGGITVYAKWVAVQYRIFLHANVDPSDTSLDWGGQSMCFRVNEGDKLANGNKIIGTRDEYEFVGWYTDAALTHPFNFGAYTINSGLDFLEDYDQTESTELDKYSNPTENTNSDAENNRVWIKKKVQLYAKWRSVMKGSRGIQVIYDAADGVNSANKQKEYTDPLYYLDQAKAIAQPASTPNSDELHFVDWVVQKWDGNSWVDTSLKVSPGDSFEILKSNAKQEENPEWDGETENEQYLYTIRLVAQYGPKDTPTPTHITWYANNKTDLSRTDPNLQINEAVDIEKDDWFTYEDHIFLGWAKLPDPTDPEASTAKKPEDLTYDDLFLRKNGNDFEAKIKQADGSTKWTVVTQVAADEIRPYEDLYAVWYEPIEIMIDHSSDKDADDILIHAPVDITDADYKPVIAGLVQQYATNKKYPYIDPTDPEHKLNLTKYVKDGHFYGGYYSAAPETEYTGDKNYWDGDKAYTASGLDVDPTAKLSDKTWDRTYYLKEVPVDYLVPKTQYVYNWYQDNVVTKLLMLTAIDDGNYNAIEAVDIEGHSVAVHIANKYLVKGKAERQFTAQDLISKDGYVVVWNVKETDPEGIAFGKYKVVSAIKDDQKVTQVLRLITPDNVAVERAERIVTIADNDIGFAKNTDLSSKTTDNGIHYSAYEGSGE